MGRSPKPTVAKWMSGNPGGRPLNTNEPRHKQVKKVPPAPDYLDDEGKTEWLRIATEFSKVGLLTIADLTGLGAYCQQYSIFINAAENIKKHGLLISSQNGFPIQSPYLGIANRAQEHMRKWLIEYGATPSSRSRIKIENQEDVDELEGLFKKYERPKVIK
jgi:P27 family predicted phage terminase small subunit